MGCFLKLVGFLYAVGASGIRFRCKEGQKFQLVLVSAQFRNGKGEEIATSKKHRIASGFLDQTLTMRSEDLPRDWGVFCRVENETLEQSAEHHSLLLRLEAGQLLREATADSTRIFTDPDGLPITLTFDDPDRKWFISERTSTLTSFAHSRQQTSGEPTIDSFVYAFSSNGRLQKICEHGLSKYGAVSSLRGRSSSGTSLACTSAACVEEACSGIGALGLSAKTVVALTVETF